MMHCLSLWRHPRVLFFCLAVVTTCALAAGCDGRPSPSAMEEDAYHLYPPHALADPFTFNLVTRLEPAQVRKPCAQKR